MPKKRHIMCVPHQNTLLGKRVRHPSDLEWQRRMEGFVDLNIKLDRMPSIRCKTHGRKEDNRNDIWVRPADTVEIDDQSSSDDPDSIDVDDDDYIMETTPDCSTTNSVQTGPDSKHQSDNIDNNPSVDYISEETSSEEELSENDDFESTISSSPIISTGSQKPENQGEAETRLKISSWIKNISWKTVGQEIKSSSDVIPDSCTEKKHVKYTKCGLAERLYRLIQQEKSAQAFHAHYIQKAANIRNTIVVIKQIQRSCSLVTCLCSVTDCKTAALIAGESINVMFTEATWLRYKLEAGITVRINAPWQILKVARSIKVMLCAYHIEVLDRPRKNSNVKSSEKSKPYREIVSRWSCPCTENKLLNICQCPAEREPIKVQRLFSSEQAHGRMVTKEENQRGLEATRLPASSDSKPETSHSLLMSIQKAGHCMEATINVIATVQRVFRKADWRTSLGNLKKSEDDCVCTLLLQDYCGFLAELMLPENSKDKEPWKNVIYFGEGRVFMFQQLRILQRINRSNSPHLFTMIDSVWSAASILEKATSSQDSDQSSVTPSQPPLFSYILQAPTGEASCDEYKTVLPSVYCERVIRPFNSILAMVGADVMARCTVEGTVVYEQLVNKDKKLLDRFIYVVSTQEEDGCLNIFVSSSSYFKIRNKNKFLLLQDIFIGEGQCVLDEYSSVCEISHQEPTSNTIHKLPKFTSSARVDMLYCLQGTLSDVDEETAYSWLVCDKCSNDKLQGGTAVHPYLYCNICKRSVSTPLNRMNLEIYVSSPEFEEYSVKVKLLQHTIKALLPRQTVDDREEGEGCDVQAVLGKPVGPMAVIVLSAISNRYLLEEVNLQ